MEKITVKNLERQIERLNKIPSEYGIESNYANSKYELDCAYGKYRLWKGGSERLNCGYTTKRDLYNCISAYIEGLKLGLTIAKNGL